VAIQGEFHGVSLISDLDEKWWHGLEPCHRTERRSKTNVAE